MRQGSGSDTEGTERGSGDPYLSQRGKVKSLLLTAALVAQRMWKELGRTGEVKGARVGGALEVKIISL